MKLLGAGVNLEVRQHRKFFFRHYLVERFMLLVKKLRFRYEVTYCRGDVGGKTPQNDIVQALPSSAL